MSNVGKIDLANIRAAFDLVNKARRLPVMLEVYLGNVVFEHQVLPTNKSIDDIRKHQYLITREVEAYMAQYEVRLEQTLFS